MTFPFSKKKSTLYAFPVKGWYLFFLIPMVQMMFSCDNAGKEKLFREGVIEYAISYDDSLDPKFNSSLRPERMVIKYKKENMMNRIEGASGAVSISIILNYDIEKSITLIKLLNKKIYYEEPIVNGEYPPTFGEMPNIIIEKTDEELDFLGFRCHKAIAHFVDADSSQFEILYTKDVDIENPNRNTPFELIDGVMLKFKVKLYDQSMIVKALNVKQSKVSYDEFEIPSDYEKVTKETIYDVIYLLK